MSTSPEFARIVESIRSCDFRRYDPDLVSSLARSGRIGDVDQLAAMATFVRVVDARSLPVRRGPSSAEFADLGQPPDFRIGGTVRDATIAAHDAPARADG